MRAYCKKFCPTDTFMHEPIFVGEVLDIGYIGREQDVAVVLRGQEIICEVISEFFYEHFILIIGSVDKTQ